MDMQATAEKEREADVKRWDWIETKWVGLEMERKWDGIGE
jgi:hypothetical protein